MKTIPRKQFRCPDAADTSFSTSIYTASKRTFDIVVGFLGSLTILPIAGIVKLTNLCSGDHAPIFYSQKRIGLHGNPFTIIKFRTMVPNADLLLAELLKQPEYRAEWEQYQKLQNDPRITPIGHILRKTSLDELPQFLNVLCGTMSFVGPRPLVLGELDDHHGDHQIYESVKPGLTGWWAVSGRSNISYDDRLELEYYYVEHQGFVIDMKCIAKTFVRIISRNGAK